MKKKLELKKETVVLLDHSAQNQVIGGDYIVKWECRQCGFQHVGQEAPVFCPVCSHVQASFMMLPS